MPDAPTVVVVRHVPWEGPHRIVEAFGDRTIRIVDALAGDPLPPTGSVAAAVVMGGPMNVDEVERYPALRAERDWIAALVDIDVPVLGVCLGSQLLARALGAEVRPGPTPEIGWAPIDVGDRDDPVVGPLAPRTSVLHWHGDVFDAPPGATVLARSAPTAVQAFRAGRAWGLLFHAEADTALVETWLAEPAMRTEAEAALGTDAAEQLRVGAARHGPDLVERSARSFAAFAAHVPRAQ